VLDAADSGYRLNLPVHTVRGAHEVAPVLTVSNPAVIVESVKLAEDRSGDLIVRLYEAAGGRAQASIELADGFAEAWRTDLLERDTDAGRWSAGEPITLELTPFQLATLRIRPLAK